MIAASVNAYSRCEKEVKATMRTIYKMYTMAKEQIPTRKLHAFLHLIVFNDSKNTRISDSKHTSLNRNI
jgi:hypothetical protein